MAVPCKACMALQELFNYVTCLVNNNHVCGTRYQYKYGVTFQVRRFNLFKYIVTYVSELHYDRIEATFNTGYMFFYESVTCCRNITHLYPMKVNYFIRLSYFSCRVL